MGQHNELDEHTEHEIRQRVQQRINERVEVYIHVAVFIAGNLGMWLLWRLTSAFYIIPILLPMLVTLGWGIGFVAHVAKVYFSAKMDQVRDREIDEAIERERMRRSMSGGKRKNEDAPKMKLSEEGELVPVDEIDDTDDLGEIDLPPRRRSKSR